MGRIAIAPVGRTKYRAWPVSASGTGTERVRRIRKTSTPPATATVTPAAHRPQVTPSSVTKGTRKSG